MLNINESSERPAGIWELRCNMDDMTGEQMGFAMEMLMEQPGRVFEVNQIMERVWGWNSDSDMNVVWVTIFNLRKTLKELGTSVTVKATRGVGYSLEEGK